MRTVAVPDVGLHGRAGCTRLGVTHDGDRLAAHGTRFGAFTCRKDVRPRWARPLSRTPRSIEIISSPISQIKGKRG